MVKVAAYTGDTGRNMFDRGKEHLAYLKKKSRKNELGGAVVEREKWKYRRWGAGAGR